MPQLLQSPLAFFTIASILEHACREGAPALRVLARGHDAVGRRCGRCQCACKGRMAAVVGSGEVGARLRVSLAQEQVGQIHPLYRGHLGKRRKSP